MEPFLHILPAVVLCRKRHTLLEKWQHTVSCLGNQSKPISTGKKERKRKSPIFMRENKNTSGTKHTQNIHTKPTLEVGLKH